MSYLDEIKDLNRRLAALLNDPHPGLFTWVKALQDVSAKIGDFRQASTVAEDAKREIMLGLLQEIPQDTVVFRSMSGAYTARDVAKSLRAGEDLGRLYASDLLRICRDMLQRQANHPAPPGT